jgi:tetratricopeptide (TPR) repeat protein
MDAPTSHGLLERERELAELERNVAAAAAGAGRVLVVEGPAGIGKTRLLAEACATARAAGTTVLRARGGVLERDFAFGVARQLLGEDVDIAGGESAPGEDPAFAAIRGLYAETARLAARGPLLLAVDDAHWADQASLRWLSYVARRIEELPVLVLVALRPGEPGAEAALVTRIAEEAGAQVVRPSPLSAAAARAVVTAALGAGAGEEFCAACHTASGGNPFFLRELVTELAAEGVEPTREAARHVEAVGPATVSRAVLLRIGRLPRPAEAIARAVAVLGDAAELGVAAQLAAVDTAGAAEAADLLAAADVLRPGQPLDFVHPVVRAAVYADIPPLQRALQHRRAAGFLAGAGGSADRVAAQLLACDPAGDPWVVARLRDAARDADRRGAPDVARRYLLRALEEPPDAGERGAVLLQLGWTEVRLTHGDAPAHLAEAIELIDDPARRTRAHFVLGRALQNAGRLDEAAEALARGIREAPASERELRLIMEADLAAAQMHLPGAAEVIDRLRRQGDDLAGDTPGECLVLAVTAFAAAQANEPAERVASLAERAVASGELLRQQTSASMIFFEATFALLFAERYDTFDRQYEAALRDARTRGTVMGFAAASAFRSWGAYRRGSIPEAEAEARNSLNVAELHGWQLTHPMALAFLATALIERGELEEARRTIESAGVGDDIPDHVIFTLLLYTRGRLRLAEGKLAEGVADVLLSGEREVRLGGRTPAGIAWRSRAAVALHRLGEHDRARELAGEELALARAFGAPRALGRALRMAGLTRPGAEGLALLREAVATLEASPAVLERAHALTDLGAALRRGRQRVEARDALRRGLDLAHACGATALAQRAHEELVAAGASGSRASTR